MSYSIKKEREKDIHKKLNNIIDDYLKGKTHGTKHARSVLTRDDYDTYFDKSEVSIKDAKKNFLKSKNFNHLLDDIKWVNVHLYNSKLEYKNEVRKILNDILEDRIAFTNDSKNENTVMIKKFEKYFEKYEMINEFKLPIMKLDEILDDVPQISKNTYKNVLVNYYKTYEEYIDLVDKKKHHYKINDMSGDIMNNNRVVFDAIIFNINEIDKIKENIVEFSIGEFYALMPTNIDVFGIEMKPTTFLDREEVKSVFEQNITNEMTQNVISTVTGFQFEKKFNDFFIWSKK